MKNQRLYYLFIFFSTFSRNIIDIYSIIFLYQKFNNIKIIVLIYMFVYLFGSIISTMSLMLGNKYGYKYLLIGSQIATVFAYYLNQHSNSVLLIASMLSLSIFMYHPIRHYYGLSLLKDKMMIGKSLIINYGGILLSQFFIIKKISIIYLIIISTIGIIPVMMMKKDNKKVIKYPHIKELGRKKILFFIFDQTKIIFLLFEPLYLYLISKKIGYIGVFNIVLTVSSIVYVYVIAYKINIEKKYKIINILFTLVLLLKLGISNKCLLLIIAFLEGIGVKTNELISTMNLYNYQSKESFTGYLIVSEIIFCLVRTGILLVIYLSNMSLKLFMYILIVGILLLSFMYQKRDNSF